MNRNNTTYRTGNYAKIAYEDQQTGRTLEKRVQIWFIFIQKDVDCEGEERYTGKIVIDWFKTIHEDSKLKKAFPHGDDLLFKEGCSVEPIESLVGKVTIAPSRDKCVDIREEIKEYWSNIRKKKQSGVCLGNDEDQYVECWRLPKNKVTYASEDSSTDESTDSDCDLSSSSPIPYDPDEDRKVTQLIDSDYSNESESGMEAQPIKSVNNFREWKDNENDANIDVDGDDIKEYVRSDRCGDDNDGKTIRNVTGLGDQVFWANSPTDWISTDDDGSFDDKYPGEYDDDILDSNSSLALSESSDYGFHDNEVPVSIPRPFTTYIAPMELPSTFCGMSSSEENEDQNIAALPVKSKKSTLGAVSLTEQNVNGIGSKDRGFNNDESIPNGVQRFGTGGKAPRRQLTVRARPSATTDVNTTTSSMDIDMLHHDSSYNLDSESKRNYDISISEIQSPPKSNEQIGRNRDVTSSSALPEDIIYVSNESDSNYPDESFEVAMARIRHKEEHLKRLNQEHEAEWREMEKNQMKEEMEMREWKEKHREDHKIPALCKMISDLNAKYAQIKALEAAQSITESQDKDHFNNWFEIYNV